MEKKILEKRGEDVQLTHKSNATDLKARTEVCEIDRKTITKQKIASYRKNYAQSREDTKKQGGHFVGKRMDLLR